jgi:hypothetical protein
MKTLLGLALALASVLLLASGCNNCEKLTDRLCKDLGPEDCASWREAGGPDSVIPRGSGVNKTCGMIMDIDASYQGFLQGARGTAVGRQLQKASAANDDAKIAELTAKQAKITAEVKAGLAKLRQQ